MDRELWQLMSGRNGTPFRFATLFEFLFDRMAHHRKKYPIKNRIVIKRGYWLEYFQEEGKSVFCAADFILGHWPLQRDLMDSVRAVVLASEDVCDVRKLLCLMAAVRQMQVIVEKGIFPVYGIITNGRAFKFAQVGVDKSIKLSKCLDFSKERHTIYAFFDEIMAYTDLN